jgi:soluble lytic murein transglycosylase-like protein
MKLAALTLIMILCVRNMQHRASAIQLIPRSLPQSTPTAPAMPLSREDAHAMIRAAALKHNVPAAFVKSIVAAESNFDPTAVSARGAIGLMQLMPELAMEYGVDPRIPEQNIDGGTRYLKVLIQRYQKSRDWLRRTIAAYNAGPGMVDKYRGVPPFRETRTYVARVLGYYRQFQREG